MRFVPDNRMLLITGLICVPLTLVAVLFPDVAGIAYGLIGCCGAAVIVDAVISRGVFQGVAVDFPEVIRLSRGKPGEIRFSMTNTASGSRTITVGLGLPERIESPSVVQPVAVLQSGESRMVDWPVTGVKQGQYRLETCYLEIRSMFGFWLCRTSVDIECELRVYPDLFSEKKTLAALFMDRGVGVHAKRMVGKGREFEKLRDYVPGDSYEDIHWKATAKRGTPISKVFQVERTQDIYLMIDGSRMSARNASIFHEGHLKDKKRASETGDHVFSRETILERYITAALITGMAAEKQGDNFGIGVFSDRVTRFIKARSGKAHFNACRDMLYTLQPNRVTPDYSELFTFVGTRIRKRSLLIILTSLDDPVLAEGFLENIHMLSRRHLVLVNMLKPSVAAPLFTDDGVNSLNAIYQNLGGHMQWNSLRELERSLSRHGTGFFLLSNSRMCPELIGQYIDIKQRQRL